MGDAREASANIPADEHPPRGRRGEQSGYAPGTNVRVRLPDPDHHNRVPGYVRGHVGRVVEAGGRWPLPDDSARGIVPPRVETVYAVRYSARDLWGTGSHTVTVDLWESYLEAVS